MTRFFITELVRIPDIMETRITYSSYAIRFIIGTDYDPGIVVSVIFNTRYHMIRIKTRTKSISMILMDDKQYVKVGRARIPIRNKTIIYKLYVALLTRAKKYINNELW